MKRLYISLKTENGQEILCRVGRSQDFVNTQMSSQQFGKQIVENS